MPPAHDPRFTVTVLLPGMPETPQPRLEGLRRTVCLESGLLGQMCYTNRMAQQRGCRRSGEIRKFAELWPTYYKTHACESIESRLSMKMSMGLKKIFLRADMFFLREIAFLGGAFGFFCSKSFCVQISCKLRCSFVAFLGGDRVSYAWAASYAEIAFITSQSSPANTLASVT